MTPFVSVVIPCKGRLEHLKDCLPALTAQTYREWEGLVIDYRCPDACGQYVAESVSDIRIRPLIALADDGGPLPDEQWNLADARNIGIKAGVGDVYWFLDADARPEPNWLERHLPCVSDQTYVWSPASFMVSRKAIWAVSGFNELLLHGWGWEDVDLFNRLNASSVQRVYGAPVLVVAHDDELRNRFHAGKATWQTMGQNQRVAGFRGL